MPVTRPSGPRDPQTHVVQHGILGQHFGRKIILTLVGVLVAYSIVWVGTEIRNNLRSYENIGYAPKTERTLRVEAEGKVTVKPDIGLTTIGMISTAETVGAAQENNSRIMTDLVARLKAMGISEADIQTANYNIYPQYQYTEKEGQVLTGYEVRQSVAVKIRDLAKANAVIALAGEVGANTVSGLEFTIDDRDAYIEAARAEAMEKLSKKASLLSEELGVRLVSVVSYDEYEEGTGGPIPMYATGGLKAGDAMARSPSIEVGSNDVILHTVVVFEIR